MAAAVRPEEVAPVKAEGELLHRMVPYLEQVEVSRKEPRCRKVGIIGAEIEMVKGAFLQIPHDVGPEPGIRANVYDENVNLAIISALILTMVMPMMYDSWDDWLESDIIESALGQEFGQSWVDDASKYLADITHLSYCLGVVGFLFSTLCSVYILLAVNEAGDDDSVILFMRKLGVIASTPYFFFQIGMAMFLGVILRILFSLKNLGLLIFELLVTVSLLILFLYAQNRIVLSTYFTINEASSFEKVHLSNEQIASDVARYLDEAGPEACLTDCLWSLQALSPNGAAVQLSAQATIGIKVEFHSVMAKRLGLSVSDEALYRFAAD